MRSRCAAMSATSQSNSSVSSTSLTIAGMPRPPQNTQRHNVVPPLLHNHERNTERVLAHVLHALQPPADQVGRHALYLVVLLVLGADLHILSIHGMGAARGCRVVSRVWKTKMCGNNSHPHSFTHLHSVHSPAHKDGVMGKRSPSHSACTRAHAIATPSTSHRSKEPCAQHKHGGNKRDGADTSTYRSPSLLPSPADWRPTLTVRHGAHHPLHS
ncbi:hypothetical protein TcCL_ESM09681 [Trypanosoma cruzi]|nr:hypothetical protein TcCL_ESM09681 [Trypanosoma cruzi]